MSDRFEKFSSEGSVHQIFACLAAGGLMRIQVNAVRRLKDDGWAAPIYTVSLQSTDSRRMPDRELLTAQDLVKISEFFTYVVNTNINVSEGES